MNTVLKTRLVGAAVLLILSGLLWPILFDFDESMQISHQTVDVPPPPRQKAEPLPEAEPAKAQDQAGAFDEADTLADVVLGNVAQAPAAGSENNVDNSVGAQGSTGEDVIREDNRREDNTAENKARAVKADENKPRLDANHIPVSYVVQVGTFSRWSNAVVLRDKLLDQKLKAYLRPETSVQKGPYVVAVGPYLTNAKAREALAQVKEKFNFDDAIVRRF